MSTNLNSSTSGAIAPNNPTSDPSESLTPLEQEVLDEYARLLENMNRLSAALNEISGSPTAEVLDELRALERKTSLVFTLLKASVYSIVLQQQIYTGEDDRREGTGSETHMD